MKKTVAYIDSNVSRGDKNIKVLIIAELCLKHEVKVK